MEKEIELYGMTLAELDTEVEIAKSAEVDEYVKTIKWSDDTDEYTKLLIVGNIRGFAFRKTTPETPINGFINKLAQRFAELTAERDALKAEVAAGKQYKNLVFKTNRFEGVAEDGTAWSITWRDDRWYWINREVVGVIDDPIEALELLAALEGESR